MLKKIGSIKVVINYYWLYAKLYTVLFFFRCIVSAVLTAVNKVYLFKIVFDAFEKQETVGYVFKVVLIIAAVNITYFIFNSWFQNIYKLKCDLKVKSIIEKDIFASSAKIDLSNYDDPQFYNDYILALGESKKRAENVMEHLGQCLYNICNIFTIAAIVITIDWIVVILVFISVTISFIFDTKIAKKNAKKEFEMVSSIRKKDYIERIFYLNEFITEMKIMNNNNFIFNEYDEAVEEARKINTKYGKKLMKINLLSGIIASILSSYIVYFVLLYKIFVIKSISIGDFSAVLSSIWNLTNALSQLVNEVSLLYADSLYCEKISKFIEMSNRSESCKNKSIEFPLKPMKLKLSNVSFSYDGKKEVLHNINLTIEPGQKIAIVGENGAGKSTLINVILNLYKNYTGSIMLNDINIKDYKDNLLYEYFSCLFQDFNMYATSIANNICMDIHSESDLNNIEVALKIVGFEDKLKKLPMGIHTILTNEYDKNGVKLSGGENNKIAIARIIISKSKVVCLDEPSSSLDPIGEMNFNKVLMSAFKERTVIFISHRFFSTHLAEKIYMMSDGKIIEEGSHNELMNKEGKYAMMYNMQKEKYKLF